MTGDSIFSLQVSCAVAREGHSPVVGEEVWKARLVFHRPPLKVERSVKALYCAVQGRMACSLVTLHPLAQSSLCVPEDCWRDEDEDSVLHTLQVQGHGSVRLWEGKLSRGL